MTPVEDPAIVFASAQLILLYLGTAAVAFPARRRHALLAKDLVTWQAMVGRHILEDIVGRVAQYVDEHYHVDKWHLGDLIAWVAQSALKYRPRICTETESGFITEDDTSPVCHTPSCPRSAKIQSTLPMMWGQW
ncbi:hypothetical protein TNCV_297731 [Trichonephila clavipes]|nr:hypothetical protein TNCV_297731 [Trichonephila clavipes]